MRTPTLQWSLLLDICAGRGKFRWKKYGAFGTAKQNVYVPARKRKAAFGLEEDPFHAYRAVDGSRAKLFASSELGGEGD
jgi:hypothetical protein